MVPGVLSREFIYSIICGGEIGYPFGGEWKNYSTSLITGEIVSKGGPSQHVCEDCYYRKCKDDI